jgi:hypothetical protein
MAINKKSQISIQFNWIFILIAGTLILIFFIGVVYKIRASSKESLACNVLSELEAIITGASVSTGTSNSIDTPDVAEIEFVCDKDGFSQFNIKGSGCKKDTPIEPIFAPSLIKGKKLITWALEFSAPFKVDNFLFLTHPQVKYVFVGNDVKQYYEELPAEINKQWIENTNSQEFTNLKTESNYKIKFIISSIPNTNIPEGLKKFSRKDISQISISPNKIEFYKKSLIADSFASEGTVPILPNNLPSIYAAIFSEDKESFECNMKKIYKRLAIISDVYSERTISLINHYKENPVQQNCELYYNLDDFVNLKDASLQCSSNIQQGCISVISTLTSEISGTNQNLKRASCPLIY